MRRVPDAKEIEDVYDDRNDEHLRLEAGEGKMLMQAVKNVKKNKLPSGSSASSDPERASSVDALLEKYLTPKPPASSRRCSSFRSSYTSSISLASRLSQTLTGDED
jgi:hypothetical protein